MGFKLFGLWNGRQNLHDDKFVEKSFLMSLAVFIAIQALSTGTIQFLAKGSPEAVEGLRLLLGTGPMPPMTIYMVNGISISIIIISSWILLAKRHGNNKINDTLNKTGLLALTFYVAHVILGMGIIETVGPLKLGGYSIEFSVFYALVFSLLCILFAQIWLRYKKSGPLEWLMRKLTN